jgi:tetratricopeptide (TPR) repeat protein/2-polyprenyl-3-methyl-5-hydroxy-6-metoxy-1,4-benzoquinol methylase
MAAAQIQGLLEEAVRQHQAGHLDQAALLYRKIIAADPGNADALHLLGMALLRQGHAEAAAELTRKAIAIQGRKAPYHFQLGAALQTLGDIEGAMASYRRALVLKPDYPDTYNNMGNALAAQGKLDEAVSSFRHVLALQPDNAVAHNNLGNVQWTMGRQGEAEASYQKAIALQPDYAGAIISLGNLRRAGGELNEAENCYRRAVALTPQSAAAHCSLGLGLWDLGRRDEAMACYRDALARDPDHVESLANLGLARWDSGALEEAEALYTRAHELRPLDPDLINNFAALLMARGNAAAAMEMIRRSLGLRETGRAKRLFVDLVRQTGWNSANAQVRAAMVRALTEPWDRPSMLGHASAEMIKLNPAIGPFVIRANASWPKRLSAAALLGDAGFAPLADDALLIALLTSAPNTDIPLERFLTMARGAMVQEAAAGDKALRFGGALAQQCFINDYIFLADDAEMTAADAARAALIAALETADAITPMQLLTVAAYFPLSSLTGSARLLERSWPAPVEAVLTQQLREPLEELRLRTEIPRLTGIENQVSQLVQSQYEENPYPRWVRLAPGTPDNIVSFLSAKFPAARFERHPGRPMRDFLVAGCGTGQQSILAAQKFGASQMLAVDLSLASLCYARRKSDELGLRIEYGHADILELAALNRQFDVIECMGVLHHMADPYAGWRAVLALLRPNGFMKLGFYSEAARRPIVEARARIAEQGFGGSADDIRKFRQELMLSGDAGIRAAILKSEDFFSVSACRDLLFHVQEHRMTLPGIEAFLKNHNLSLLGFELDDAVLDAYRQRFPDDAAATDLIHWERFEAEHPGMFAGMYAFWIWKAS